MLRELDWQIKSKNQIDENLKKEIDELEADGLYIQSLGEFLYYAADAYEKCELEVLAMVEALPGAEVFDREEESTVELTFTYGQAYLGSSHLTETLNSPFESLYERDIINGWSLKELEESITDTSECSGEKLLSAKRGIDDVRRV